MVKAILKNCLVVDWNQSCGPTVWQIMLGFVQNIAEGRLLGKVSSCARRLRASSLAWNHARSTQALQLLVGSPGVFFWLLTLWYVWHFATHCLEIAVEWLRQGSSKATCFGVIRCIFSGVLKLHVVKSPCFMDDETWTQLFAQKIVSFDLVLAWS